MEDSIAGCVDMARRKEVFQSKVLQKLYPAAPTLGKDLSSPHIETPVKTTHVKRRTSGHAGKTEGAANPSLRIYTVLPPPPDYNMHSENSVIPPQLESMNGTEDPPGEDAHESSEEPDDEKEAEEQKRRKRKRKRKPTPLQDSGKDQTVQTSESSTSHSQASVDEGGERLSRNKKRKLKKKRHKEKLLSMGLMPRAAALEFTYQKEETEGEDEDNRRRAAELSDFLRTTAEIYMSDSSLHVATIPQLSIIVDDLVNSIASGCKPESVLKQLCCLKALVQQCETENLEKALGELNNNPFMSAEETTAVISLCKYWITDILPMQRDKTTALCGTHT